MFGPVGIMARPVQFLCLEPLDTLVASELHVDSGGLGEGGVDIDIDVAIDSFTCKVELLVSLDVKVGHKFHNKDFIIQFIIC